MLAAHEIFGFMSERLAYEIVEQLHQNDRESYKNVLAAVAEAQRVRPEFLQRKPRAEQHRIIREWVCRPRLEAAAITLLQNWLVKIKTEMLKDFLDELGIKHENGIVDELPTSVEDAKLKAAVELLLSKYPAEQVAVYLHAFNSLNQTNWPNLAQMLDADERLQLGTG